MHACVGTPRQKLHRLLHNPLNKRGRSGRKRRHIDQRGQHLHRGRVHIGPGEHRGFLRELGETEERTVLREFCLIINM